MAWSLAILFLTALVYLEAAPTAFVEIGWRYYLLFIALTVINMIAVYLLFPETMGLSLEEIGAKFGDDVVVRLTGLNQDERDALDRQISWSKEGAETSHVEGDNVGA